MYDRKKVIKPKENKSRMSSTSPITKKYTRGKKMKHIRYNLKSIVIKSLYIISFSTTFKLV
jgi:hypothetical protein